MNELLCRSTERKGGKTLVCELKLGHDGKCKDLLGNEWDQEPQVFTGELIL